MRKTTNWLMVIICFVFINGCTAMLWDTDYLGNPIPANEKKKYEAKIAKNKNYDLYINLSNHPDNESKGKNLLLSKSDTEFNDKLMAILYPPNFLEVTSIDIIIDELDSSEKRPEWDTRYNKVKASFGFKFNISNDDVKFMSKSDTPDNYNLSLDTNEPYEKSDIKTYGCFLNLSPIFKLLIMDQWANKIGYNYPDLAGNINFDQFAKIEFKGFLDKNGRFLNSDCVDILNEIEEGNDSYIGGLFLVTLNSRTELSELEYYVDISINIKPIIRLIKDLHNSYNLAPEDGNIGINDSIYVSYSAKSYLDSKKYYINFSDNYVSKNNMVDNLSEHEYSPYFDDKYANITMVKRKSHSVILKVVATPFTVVADIILIPLGLLALLM